MSKVTDNDLELEAGLQALLLGQLDPDSAYAITDHLAERPERLREVITDARNAAALRLALSSPEDTSPAPLVAQAHGLQDRLRGQRMLRRAAPVAAALVLFATGWIGHAAWQMTGATGAPPLVEAALDAQAALEIRHWMVSQPENTDMNSQELAAALGFVLPPLPEDWVVQDVQIVATPDRPGIAISVNAPDLGEVFLFAVSRKTSVGKNAPTSFDYNGRSIAVFERENSSYVLVDNSGHPDQLFAGANKLMSRMGEYPQP